MSKGTARPALTALASDFSGKMHSGVRVAARRLGLPLREKLILAFLVVVIVAAGSLALVTVYLIDARMEESVRASLTHSLTMVRAEYRNRGQQVQFAIRNAASSPAVRQAIIQRDETELQHLITVWKSQTPEVQLWLIADPEGQILARLHPGDGKNDPPFSELIARAAAQGEAQISTELVPSDVVEDEGRDGVGDRMALVTATPITQGQNVIGVVVTGELVDADFPVPDTLRDQLYGLSTVGSSTQQHGPIVSFVQGGTIVSTCFNSRESTILGTRLPSEALEEIQAGRSHWGTDTIGGQRYLTLVDPLRNTEDQIVGALLVGLPERGFVAWRADTMKSLLAVFLVVSLVALLVAASLADMITLPLRDLTTKARAIADGRLDVRVSGEGHDEIGELGRAFNEMTAQLHESYAALRQERRKALAAIEASVDGIWVDYVVNGERRIAMINSSLERMTGHRRSELVGRPCRYLLGVCTMEGLPICDTVCPFLRPREETSGFVEGTIPTADGKKIPVEVGYGRILDENDRLVGAVHVVRDLTPRREVEQLKDEFISMVSHELWTPLNHIKGFSSTLLQADVSWDANTQRDFLQSIDREADRLTKLVENLLQMSRIEAGGLEGIDKHWYRASDLLDRALARIRQETQEHRVEIQIDDDLRPVMADGQSIEIVLVNLIENATKYSKPGSEIIVQAQAKAGEVVFRVIDRGVGIAEQHLDHVFDRFYRVGGSPKGGTGLGLAICRRIVEGHGGRMWASSALGKGSTFSFALPSAEGSDVAAR